MEDGGATYFKLGCLFMHHVSTCWTGITNSFKHGRSNAFIQHGFFPEMTKTRYGFLEIWRLLDQSVTFCSSLIYFCFQRDSSFSDYTQHIVTSSSPNCTDCLCSDTVSHGQIFMDESWDNATLRCITRNTTYFIELSAETTISLGPSRMCRMFYGLDFIIRFTLSTNPYKCWPNCKCFAVLFLYIQLMFTWIHR